MRYTEKVLKQASNILDKWIIEESISDDECTAKISALGVQYSDISDMMELVNYKGIKSSYDEIQEYNEDYNCESYDNDEDPYEEFIKQNNSF